MPFAFENINNDRYISVMRSLSSYCKIVIVRIRYGCVMFSKLTIIKRALTN